MKIFLWLCAHLFLHVRGPARPADQGDHNDRGGYRGNFVCGQLVITTDLDPVTQDRLRGFPKNSP